MSYQGLLYLPHSVCTLLLLHANNKGADQPAHPRSHLALESMIAKPATNKNKIPLSDMRVLIQTTPTGAGCFSREVRTSFFFLEINDL